MRSPEIKIVFRTQEIYTLSISLDINYLLKNSLLSYLFLKVFKLSFQAFNLRITDLKPIYITINKFAYSLPLVERSCVAPNFSIF